MIRFGFGLYPLDEVSPWGDDQPSLHWFGLTQGWYWFEVREHRLLRRSRVDQPHPYVDYYLARLWEDVNALTPDVLEVVPGELQPFIATDSTRWTCDPLTFITSADQDAGRGAPDHPVVTAANWYSAHQLDFGYLRNAPGLRLWRTTCGGRDEITVDWRHEDDGEIGFTAGPAVRCSVPTDAYLEAVHTLDRQLMSAMYRRVQELQRRGGLPGIDVDLDMLWREQQDRTQWLAENLDRSPETDWTAVRQGARQLLGDVPGTPAGR